MKALTLEDFYDYQYLSDVRLSPDGQEAAFVVTRADVPANGYQAALWLFRFADGSVRQLTETGRDTAPCWLAPGKLLYQSKALR